MITKNDSSSSGKPSPTRTTPTPKGDRTRRDRTDSVGDDLIVERRNRGPVRGGG
jgi:hypothetical protein